MGTLTQIPFCASMLDINSKIEIVTVMDWQGQGNQRLKSFRDESLGHSTCHTTQTSRNAC